MIPLAPAHVNKRDLYARSPFQVALLFLCTLGIYVLWWSYRIRKSVAAMLEEPDQPVWNTLALFVPLLNLFVFYTLFEKIKVASLRAGLQPPSALAAWGFLGVLIFAVFGRLPLPYLSLAIFYFLPFAIAHFYFMHAELRLMGAPAIPHSFSVVEILIIILGLGFRALIMIGETFHVDASKVTILPGAWFSWLCLCIAIIALIVLQRRGEALVARVIGSNELRKAPEVTHS